MSARDLRAGRASLAMSSARHCAIVGRCWAPCRAWISAASRMMSCLLSCAGRAIGVMVAGLLCARWTRNSKHGGRHAVRRAMAHDDRWARDVALGRASCLARRCTAAVRKFRGGGRRPAAARRSSGDVVTADFFLGLCSGLSRAAHGVFGPIFDIGPVLVDFEILSFLDLKLF
ncbi:hypothetical protein F511_46921 [Dorcoceras hygrometricum]|uniref:Uncharacterized protein n=1 Tax=Dorcoceras hygrometricum TaxID=472368 RepID=A0A2Z6ZSB1_9LAMI|nr:hypothetical protein F511_46921 [Dorcoceras hygrometricum]